MALSCPSCNSPIARPEQRFCYRCGYELLPQSPQEVAAQSSSSPATPSNSGPSSPDVAPPNPAQQTLVINSPETADVPPPQSSNKALLRVLLPNGDVFDKEINKPEVQIGKGPRNDVVIADPAVSTSHAVLRVDQSGYTIADVGSRNGTFINSERITEPRRLTHGDVIGVGLSKLTFRLQGHSETSVIDVGGFGPAQYAPPPLTEDSLAAAVISEGFASRSHIDQLRGRGRRLARALVDEKLMPEDRLRDLFNRVFQIPTIDFRSTNIDEDVAVNFPSRIARDHLMFAFRKEGDTLVVAVFDPTDAEGMDKIRLETRANVRMMVATASEISEQVEKFYGPKIIGVLPSGEKLRYLITNQHEISIGKAPHNEIVLNDPTVSNTHAVIMIRDGGYSIVDLGSRNGTFVNGERLSTHAHTLLHGDSIQLGQTVLTFRNSGQTTQNTTAVLSLDAIEEVRRRAGYGDVGLPDAQPYALQPVGRGAGLAAPPPPQGLVMAGGQPGEVIMGEVVEDEDAEKKKKKKKKKKDERIKAAYVSGLSRILAQVLGAVVSAALTIIVAFYALRPAAPPKVEGPGSTNINPGQGEKKTFSSMGTITQIRGGLFEASGVIQVPDSSAVLFVTDSREKQVLYAEFDQSGNQVTDPKPISLGTTASGVEVAVKDAEAITYGGGFFYMIGGQSDPTFGEKNALVRFVFDQASQSVRDAEIITDLRSFLLANVPELQGEGEKPGTEGGLNVEGIAWDPLHERLLLGLRSPIPNGQAMIIPLKFRDPRGGFTKENLTLAEPRVIKVNLEGFGIRDIHFDAHLNSFLIVSGAPDNLRKSDFKLWQWNGDANSQPKSIAGLDPKMKPEGVTRVRISGRDYLLLFGDGGYFQKFDYAE
ncbi:MAG TPA: DUF3616 domain-containing protein [Blastocatellia bacterium]